jgi:hypothetical protein
MTSLIEEAIMLLENKRVNVAAELRDAPNPAKLAEYNKLIEIIHRLRDIEL